MEKGNKNYRIELDQLFTLPFVHHSVKFYMVSFDGVVKRMACCWNAAIDEVVRF